ncbi:MAG: FkbM family methyltransferase [Paracoccaceae bacterium]
MDQAAISFAAAMGQLEAAFTDPSGRSHPLPHRLPITARLERLMRDAVDLIRCDLVMEIGAHEAAFSCEMKAAHPDLEVIAVEANPRVVERYRKAVTARGIAYLNLAVDAAPGEVSLFIPEVIAGRDMPHVNRMASLKQVQNPNSVMTEITVEAVTLDSLTAEIPCSRACLWVDVEGAVDRIILGGSDTLRRTALFYCEVESGAVWKDQQLAGTIAAMMQAAGFTPVARDCQKWHQHNVLYVRHDLLATQGLANLTTAYCAEALALFALPAAG